MGKIRWSPSDWDDYKKTTASKSQSQIFTSSGLDPSLDPKKFGVRESRDSPANPNSTPIIIAVDETGSMGYLAEEIIKRGLGVIMQEIYDRKPVTDPHIMCVAVGDAYSDTCPIQMTQFEAGVAPLTSQVEKLYLEGNGGGNGGESYNLVWYAGAHRTDCDAFKHGRKGYLFTIGDEPPHPSLTRATIAQFFGDQVEIDLSNENMLDDLLKNWEVFHLGVGAFRNSYGGRGFKEWKRLLGERAIEVTDHTKLAEVIVSTIQVIEGADVATVVGSWSGDTSVVVRDAIGALTSKSASGGVVAL